MRGGSTVNEATKQRWRSPRTDSCRTLRSGLFEVGGILERCLYGELQAAEHRAGGAARTAAESPEPLDVAMLRNITVGTRKARANAWEGVENREIADGPPPGTSEMKV